MSSAVATAGPLALPPVSPALTVVAGGREGSAAAQAVEAAEAANASNDFAAARDALADVRFAPADAPRLAFRAAVAKAWAELHLGDVDAATAAAEHARDISETRDFSAVDRADALFHLACCRLRASAVANAISLLTVALDLCDRTPLPCDRLRALVLERRARCYLRRRDWEAARFDVERALELAEASGDDHVVAHVYFQASIVAEREKQWIVARMYAEEARARYERVGDNAGLARVLNNLGGIAFLLGSATDADAYLEQAFRVSLDADDAVGAAYAVSSRARVNLGAAAHDTAETQALHALQLLHGRTDHAAEIGNAQLVLGRARLGLGRIDDADAAFAQAEQLLVDVSAGHLSAAWVARGDAASARGDTDAAAALYRRAAEVLQELNF